MFTETGQFHIDLSTDRFNILQLPDYLSSLKKDVVFPLDVLANYEEVMKNQWHTPIDRAEVEKLNSQFGYEPPGKIIYGGVVLGETVKREVIPGLPIERVVKATEGIAISEKAYHMAVNAPFGELYAQYGLSFASLATGCQNPSTLEMFMGIGSLTASLALNKHDVFATIDNNRGIWVMAKHNWGLLELNRSTSLVKAEALDYVRESIIEMGVKFD